VTPPRPEEAVDQNGSGGIALPALPYGALITSITQGHGVTVRDSDRPAGDRDRDRVAESLGLPVLPTSSTSVTSHWHRDGCSGGAEPGSA
jgi:hypothetical protein